MNAAEYATNGNAVMARDAAKYRVQRMAPHGIHQSATGVQARLCRLCVLTALNVNIVSRWNPVVDDECDACGNDVRGFVARKS